MRNNFPNVIPFDRPASYWRKKAEQSRSSSQYTLAARYFSHALQKSGDAGIKRDLADTYAAMGSYTISSRLYLEILSQDPFDGKSCWGLAANCRSQGHVQMMADAMSTYLYVTPYGEYADIAADMLNSTAQEAEAAGKRGMRAYTLLQHSKKYLPADKRAWKLAMKAYNLSSSAESCLMLYELAAVRGIEPLALKYAQKALRAKPKDLLCRLACVLCLFDSGRYSASRILLRSSEPLCKTEADAVTYCTAACHAGSTHLAIHFSENRLSLLPQSIDRTKLLAACCQRAGFHKRAEELMNTVFKLDANDETARYYIEHPDIDLPMNPGGLPEQLIGERLVEAFDLRCLINDEDRWSRDEMRRLLSIPVQWLQQLVLSKMHTQGDISGLRLALVMPSLLAKSRIMAIQALFSLKAPVPYISTDGVGLDLIRAGKSKERDSDRAALIRTLSKWLKDAVSLERVCMKVPPLWNKLSEAARRHCAESTDDVWPLAFSMFLLDGTERQHKTRTIIKQHPRKKRILRAYKQLLHRMETSNEMYRF